MTTPGGGTRTCAKQPNQVPFRESRHRYVPGCRSHPGATHTSAGEIIERRCCLGSVAFVASAPASTTRADERNVGEEIERSATSIAPPSRWLQVPVAEQAGRNRRPHITSEKLALLRRRHCYFPGGVDHIRGRNPSRTKHLHEVLLWRFCLACFPRGSDRVGGENTNNSR